MVLPKSSFKAVKTWLLTHTNFSHKTAHLSFGKWAFYLVMDKLFAFKPLKNARVLMFGDFERHGVGQDIMGGQALTVKQAKQIITQKAQKRTHQNRQT